MVWMWKSAILEMEIVVVVGKLKLVPGLKGDRAMWELAVPWIG